jgi:hypothetical protein
MIPILLAPLTQNKVTKFEHFTEVNRPDFDRLRKAVSVALRKACLAPDSFNGEQTLRLGGRRG